MIKALKKLYAEKPQTPKNPFAHNNQENRFSQQNESGMSVNRTGKRKFNDISEDIDSDEEEKYSQTSSQEDSVCDNYTNYLLWQLKSTQNEEAAFHLIKKWMLGFKKDGESSDSNSQWQKKKVTEKQMRMVADAVKKLLSDNLILKKGVNKLVENEAINAEKVKQFDTLAFEYNKLTVENLNLKKNVEMLKYQVRGSNDSNNYSSHHNNFNNHGGPGVF